MKVAIALCLMCVIGMVYGQAARTAAAGGSSSDAAIRNMVAKRMFGGRGGGAGLGRMGNLSTLMFLRGGMDPMEFMLCRHNMMMCLMMMN